MVIYGVALLAGCVLAGCVLAGLGLGGVLGWAIGVKANVGGVGAAMLLLIWLREKLLRSALLVPATEQGFSCWNAMTGAIIAISYFLADRLTRGRWQGAPIAILLGLLLAWIDGTITGGKKASLILKCLQASVFWAVRCCEILPSSQQHSVFGQRKFVRLEWPE